jgi:hypothetical protein
MTRLALLAILAACGGGGGTASPDAAPWPDAGPTPTIVGEVRVTTRTSLYLEPYTAPHVWAGFYLPERPVYQTLREREGDCELARFQPTQCAGPCDGVCVPGGTCVSFIWASAGALTVTGQGSVTLPYVGGWYQGAGLPTALLDSDQLTIDVEGADVPAFSTTVDRPGPLLVSAIEHPVILVPDQPLVVTWTPADPASRVRLTLNSFDVSHGSLRSMVVTCDVADAAGQIIVPARFFPEYPAYLEGAHPGNCPGTECPPSILARYRQAFVPLAGGAVEITVGSEVAFWPAAPASE